MATEICRCSTPFGLTIYSFIHFAQAALGTLKAEFQDQVKNMTKVLFSTNDAHTGTEKLLASSEKFTQAQQAIIELNGEFDSQLASFGSKKSIGAIQQSLNAGSRIMQRAAKSVHAAAHMRVSFANSFSTIGTCAKRDRLTMLTINELLKEREQLIKKHESKRADRLRKDLQYKTMKKQERFEDAQKLEQVCSRFFCVGLW